MWLNGKNGLNYQQCNFTIHKRINRLEKNPSNISEIVDYLKYWEKFKHFKK